MTCLLLSTDNKAAGENPSDKLVKSHVSFRSSRENSRGAITFVIYWHRCQITTAKHSRLSYVKGSYLRGIRWLIAGQSASMLTSFSVCREEWGGHCHCCWTDHSPLNFNLNKRGRRKYRVIEEVITLWLFDRNKKKNIICNEKSEAKPSVSDCERTTRDWRSREKREIRKEGSPSGSKWS